MPVQSLQTMPVKAVLTLALAFAFAGCSTVGPNFTAPAAPDVPAFRHVDNPALDTACSAWRR
jgi:starvation-inducible outer membrane lipoprotein